MDNNKVAPAKEEIYAALCRRHGKEVQDILWDSHVAIAGLGGLGSVISVALARAGVGHLHLIDFDQVDLENLNRQQYRLKDIGRNKTECIKEYIAEFNPYLDVRIDTCRIDESNVGELFLEDSIVCEAFDSPTAKSMLVDGFFTHYGKDKKMVSATGMAGYGDSNLIQTKKWNDRFYLCGDQVNGIENVGSLMAPRVGICACHEANMIIQLLLEDK